MQLERIKAKTLSCKLVTWLTVCLSLTLVFLRSAVALSTCKAAWRRHHIYSELQLSGTKKLGGNGNSSHLSVNFIHQRDLPIYLLHKSNDTIITMLLIDVNAPIIASKRAFHTHSTLHKHMYAHTKEKRREKTYLYIKKIPHSCHEPYSSKCPNLLQSYPNLDPERD